MNLLKLLIVCFTLALSIKNCYGRCNPLMTPANGRMQGQCDGLRYGEICTFNCLDGLPLVGFRMVICNPDDTWSSLPPTCGRGTKKCPLLTAPSNGYMRGDCGNKQELNMNGREPCTFDCYNGYRLVGIRDLCCLVDGTYSAAEPFCVRN